MIGLLTVLLTLPLAGCGTEAEKTPEPQTASEPAVQVSVKTHENISDATDLYTQLTDGFYTLIYSGGTAVDLSIAAETGVREALMGKTREEALSSIGYTVQDLNGDGTPELLIGEISEQKDGTCFGRQIYAACASPDGFPFFFIEGWARNRYFWLGDGEFLNEGSNGAASSVLAAYTLPANKKSLQCSDFYFTEEKENAPGEITVYHNTTGEWDSSISEETSMTSEEFGALWTDLESRIQPIELTPFSEYEMENSSETPVRVQMLSGVPSDSYPHLAFVPEEVADTQSYVLFSVSQPVNNFKLLNLSFENAAEDGKASFKMEEYYAVDTLTPDCPLVAAITFAGDIPSNGIFYTDEDGTAHTYSLSISGKDGSLVLDEI